MDGGGERRSTDPVPPASHRSVPRRVRSFRETSSVGDGTTLRRILEDRAAGDPSHVFCVWGDRTVTVGDLNIAVNRFANALVLLGISHGDHVATMLPNHPDHIVAMLALVKIGAVWIPVNTQLRGVSLSFAIEHCRPRMVIADADYAEALDPLLADVEFRVWRGAATRSTNAVDFEALAEHPDAADPPGGPAHADVLCVSYTSGTTGQPKGVLLTDKMLRACGVGSAYCGDLRSKDVVLVWEPLYHAGGSQLVVLALLLDVTLVLLERFSASRFWEQVRANNVTAFHYLGGILQILLKQPPSPRDRQHSVRTTWGGGCTAEIWRRFEERFGIVIHEDYGLTEASSYATCNHAGKVGSIGTPLPYFEVRIVDESFTELAARGIGEIVLRGREPGLLLPGYYNNPEATAAALCGEWFRTGDFGSRDEEGFFYFHGRKKDSVRRRGENISAWEVERVLNDHPDVEESALISVPNDIGDEDLKIVIKPAPGRHPDAAGIAAWCSSRMPSYQVPRYFAFVAAFEKTPTERIKKEALSRSTADSWDREAATCGNAG